MPLHVNNADDALSNLWVYVGTQKIFHIDINEIPNKFKHENVNKPWTKLQNFKCSFCPLREEENLFCPVAVILSEVIEGFKSITSYCLVTIEVEDKSGRLTKMKLTGQEAAYIALRSTIFLSRCPILEKYKGLLFDLRPLATENEFFTHLVTKAFLQNRSNKTLTKSFIHNAVSELNEINVCMANRIRNFTHGSDAVVNAIVVSDFLWKGLVFFDEILGELVN